MVTGVLALIELLPFAVNTTFLKLVVFELGLIAWLVIVMVLPLNEQGWQEMVFCTAILPPLKVQLLQVPAWLMVRVTPAAILKVQLVQFAG